MPATDAELIAKVKTKYPEYAAMDDKTAAQQFVQKYPVYAPRLTGLLGEASTAAPAQSFIQEDKGLFGRILERAGVPTTRQGWANHYIRGPLGLLSLPGAIVGENVDTALDYTGRKRPGGGDVRSLGGMNEMSAGSMIEHAVNAAIGGKGPITRMGQGRMPFATPSTAFDKQFSKQTWKGINDLPLTPIGPHKPTDPFLKITPKDPNIDPTARGDVGKVLDEAGAILSGGRQNRLGVHRTLDAAADMTANYDDLPSGVVERIGGKANVPRMAPDFGQVGRKAQAARNEAERFPPESPPEWERFTVQAMSRKDAEELGLVARAGRTKAGPGGGGVMGPSTIRPISGGNGTVPPSGPSGWWERLKDKLPQDYRLYKQDEGHGGVIAYEGAKHDLDTGMHALLNTRAFRSRTDLDEWLQAEQRAVDVARQTGSLDNGIASLPEHIREARGILTAQRDAEKAARTYFPNAKELTDDQLYVLPHMVDKTAKDVVKINKRMEGVGSEWRTTLGSFEKERPFDTMLEGTARGSVSYADPQQALLHRIWAGQKLIFTANFIKRLEDSQFVFRTKEAAVAAAKPGETAHKIDGVPGMIQLWTTSKPQALFVRDQLVDPKSYMADAKRFGDAFFRNFNLWNPLPHFSKNMLYKYGFSGGQYRHVFQDMREWHKGVGKNPESQAILDAYNAVMPSQRSGRSAHDIFQEAMWRSGKGVEGGLWANAMKSPEGLWHLVNTPNRGSSRMVFGLLDPALKYARFKQYMLKEGKTAEEAANAVHLDLIRYGTRSELMDKWKAIPFNFFVPWRVGTVQSLVKNAQTAPLRAGMFVLAADMVREAVYNSTGYWVHMPIDYIQQPVAQAIESWGKGAKQGAVDAGRLAATTALLGPGGGSLYRLVGSMINTLQSHNPADLQLLRNAMWGFAIVGDPRDTLPRMAKFSQNLAAGNMVAVANDITAIIGQAAFASHDALNHKPDRMLEFVPSPKHPMVEQAEKRQKYMDTMKDRRFERPSKPKLNERLRSSYGQ